MNHRSSWFSARNALEYYFWFKSRLHLHSRVGFIPLGGNSVFVRRSWLLAMGGWDEDCLAEDCDLGARLSTRGATTCVAFTAALATREETPAGVYALLRQRTRWSQGFLQVLRKGEWRALPPRARAFAVYTLAFPFLQAASCLILPFAIASIIVLNLPMELALLSFAPLVPFTAILAVELVGLHSMRAEFGLRVRICSTTCGSSSARFPTRFCSASRPCVLPGASTAASATGKRPPMSAPTSESHARRGPAPTAGAVAATVIDWPLEPSWSARAPSRVLAWLRANHLDAVAVVAALTPTLIVHAWGMQQFPALFDDEGAYVSQAYAVDKLHALAPYTYWYDHPPLGWILLGAWAKLTPLFSPSSSTIAGARTFIFLLFAVSSMLLYGIARRLSLSPGTSALAVGLFGLSPLAVDYQRMVLLDNIATPMLLAAFFLALTPKRRMVAYAGAAVCFGAAILTKETFLLFLPGLTLAIWTACVPSTRRFALAVFGALVFCIGAFYPLFALLRGELLPGRHHTSLLDGIRFQLSRVGGGSIFNAHSPTRHLVDGWLRLDSVLLVCRSR